MRPVDLCSVSVTLQCGQRIVHPHSRHETKGEKPRLFWKSITCSPRDNAPSMARMSSMLKWPRRSPRLTARIVSETTTSG